MGVYGEQVLPREGDYPAVVYATELPRRHS
jgi:hypothetical protein